MRKKRTRAPQRRRGETRTRHAPDAREIDRQVLADRLHDLDAALANADDQAEMLGYDLRLEAEIPASAEAIREALREVFGEAPDVIVETVRTRPGRSVLVAYVAGLVDTGRLSDTVIEPIRRSPGPPMPAPGGAERFSRGKARALGAWLASTLATATGEPVTTVKEASNHMLLGDAVVLAGPGEGMAVPLEGGAKRSVQAPKSEQVITGPHEGFIEEIDVNLSLVRRRVRTPRLRVDALTVGRLSRTRVYVLSVRGVSDDLLLGEVHRRLARVDTDSVQESNQIMERIRDSANSPLPTILRTERPDRVAAGLVQGKVAILSDGSPFAMVMPTTFWTFLTSDEDYYQHWLVSTVVRWIRLLALLTGVFVPGLYVAITTYHQNFLPTPLLVTIAGARENAPLPALIEVLAVLVLFEVIREAGVRVPKGIGSALTIGGTLVVGDAAVKAGIVSSPTIIIGAAVVIAFFAIPVYDFVQTVRFALYPLLLAAGFFGAYGFLFVSLVYLLHLASLRSFGVSYMSPFGPLRPREFRDTLLREPWWLLDRRPAASGFPNPVAAGPHQRPEPPPRRGSP